MKKGIRIEWDTEIVKNGERMGVDLLGYLLAQVRRQIEAMCKT